MTHGEAWYKTKQLEGEGKMKDDYTPPSKLPKPMQREDAAKYYNTKLFAYWMDQLDDRLSIHKKAQIVSALMFGHTEKYKLFED